MPNPLEKKFIDFIRAPNKASKIAIGEKFDQATVGYCLGNLAALQLYTHDVARGNKEPFEQARARININFNNDLQLLLLRAFSLRTEGEDLQLQAAMIPIIRRLDGTVSPSRTEAVFSIIMHASKKLESRDKEWTYPPSGYNIRTAFENAIKEEQAARRPTPPPSKEKNEAQVEFPSHARELENLHNDPYGIADRSNPPKDLLQAEIKMVELVGFYKFLSNNPPVESQTTSFREAIQHEREGEASAPAALDADANANEAQTQLTPK